MAKWFPLPLCEGFPDGKSKTDTRQWKNRSSKSRRLSFHSDSKTFSFPIRSSQFKERCLENCFGKTLSRNEPEDAHHLKIEDGETVQVSTPDGQSLQMKVKFSSKPVSGVITTPYPSPLIEEKGINSVKVERLKRS